MAKAIADCLVQLEPFFIEFGQAFLHGDMLLDKQEGDLPEILFLHGGVPEEDRLQFHLLRQILLKQYALPSCAFDFIGHGSSGGEWGESSLRERSFQATDIVYACFDSQPFSVVAVGMGAHVACKLLDVVPIQNLVLLSPRLYHRDAYRLSFADAAFATLAEQVGSCLDNTDIFDCLRKFTGNLCLISGNEDAEVIDAMVGQFHRYSLPAASQQQVYFPTQLSQVFLDSGRNALILDKMASAIAGTCKRT